MEPRTAGEQGLGPEADGLRASQSRDGREAGPDWHAGLGHSEGDPLSTVRGDGDAQHPPAFHTEGAELAVTRGLCLE